MLNTSSMSYYSTNFFPTYHPDLYQSYYQRNFIQYDDYYYHHAPSSQFAVSYCVSKPESAVSVAEFGEPEFEDYDPTPYGGGYDITATYGKPLPPSEEICYPPSVPNPSPPLLLDGSPEDGSKNIPPVKDEIAHPSAPKEQELNVGTIKEEEEEEEEKVQLPLSTWDGSDDRPVDDGEETGDEEAGEVVVRNDNLYPWSGYEENGFGGFGNLEETGGLEGRRGVPQAEPFGYNPDAMDFCESLFGYWPCLYRRQRKTYGQQKEEGSAREESDYDLNQLRRAADYIFGDSYEYQNQGGFYGNYVVHQSYGRHFQGEGFNNCREAVDGCDQSLSQKLNLFEGL